MEFSLKTKLVTLPRQGRGAAGGRRRRGVLLPAVLHLPGEADQARPKLPRAGERVPQPAGRLAGVPAGAGLPLSRL